ncbi:MAG TPA: transporter substrate-binding domain-containing protein [Burkholderiaceae bacterium]
MPLPPQTMQDKNGLPTGYATSILQAVAKRLDWDIDIRYMPWLRVVADSKMGQCDIAYTVLKRPDYEEFLVFPRNWVLEQKNVLVVLRTSDLRFNGNLEQFMRLHTIGLYRDKAVDAQFEKLRRAPWARIELANDPSQNFAKLFMNRFEAAIENDMTTVYEVGKLGRLDEIEILSPPLNITPAYIVFAKAGRLANSINEFDAAMDSFMRSDEVRLLNRQYFGALK